MNNKTLKENVLESIEKYISKYSTRRDELSDFFKLSPKFFIVSYAEEFYTLTIDIQYITLIKDGVETTSDDTEVIDYIHDMKEDLTYRFINFPLTEHSSNPMTGLTNIWEKESLRKIIKTLEDFCWKYHF